MSDRVVITGLGAISPLGLNALESWQNVIEGVSGVAPITGFDTTDLLAKIACEVKGYDPEESMPYREARRRERFEQFATTAARQALAHSGFEITEANADRIGVIISSAIGGIGALQDAVETLHEEGPRRISPFAIPMMMANGASGLVGIDLGARGPCFSVTSACASGADGVGIASMLIQTGVIDVAIAGGSESTITPVAVGAFDRVGALSRRNEDHQTTPKPFDLNRDGLVMGEGAGVLILEREEYARSRGAEILAELAGYAATSDSHHITAPIEDGSGGARAIREALRSAQTNLDEVSYINAHGTGTILNDLSETRAIKAAFGDLAYNIPVSSTKSMTGHMMGATGALEAIFCVQAVRENRIPPTLHYQTPDPECDLDYVPGQSRDVPVEVAVSNAFGFGGHNAVLVLRAYR
jgi:beta-ketoacyl-acyl-carrier-protein synthase II